MERRKIQKVGSSTLSIALPKNWTNLTGVKRGDAVYLEQGRDGTLRILSENLVEEDRRPKEFAINCDRVTEPRLLERLIVGSYMHGVDIIKIFSSTRINGGQVEEIRKMVQRLIGFSIMGMSKEEINIQCFLDPSKFKINSLIQNLSAVTSVMLNEAMAALVELDPELANDVIERENEANSIFWLIRRLVFSSLQSQRWAEEIGVNDPFDPTDIIVVSRNLETIADCSLNIAKVALDFHRITHDRMIRENIDEKSLEEIPLLGQSVEEVFKKTVESLFSKDLIPANDAINLRRKLDDRIDAVMRTTTTPYFRAIMVAIAVIAENCASIASLAFDLELRRFKSFPFNAGEFVSKP